jgi:formylglycine-generating enzyme required for sulfatase activity
VPEHPDTPQPRSAYFRDLLSLVDRCDSLRAQIEADAFYLRRGRLGLDAPDCPADVAAMVAQLRGVLSDLGKLGVLLREGLESSGSGQVLRDGQEPAESVVRVADGLPWERPGTVAGQEIIGPDGGPMVWAPPGWFTMGDDSGPADARPAHPVTLTHGLWIGKFTVTNAQYAAFLTVYGGAHSEVGLELVELEAQWSELYAQGTRYLARAGRERHPVVGVSWFGAQHYAEHYGMHLPTEAEWEYAARGNEGRQYPWGDEWDPERCCCPAHHGSGVPGTLPVGDMPAGASWCGALDMAGNVWEWCADWYGEETYRTGVGQNPSGPNTGQFRVLRGGSWVPYPDNCRTTFRFKNPPVLLAEDYGFRVCIRPARATAATESPAAGVCHWVGQDSGAGRA